MADSKDPGIKLFGRQIPLSSAEASAAAAADDDDDLPLSSEIDGEEGDEAYEEHDLSIEKSAGSMQMDDDSGPVGQEPRKSETCSDAQNPKTPSISEESTQPGENGKALKKPDKILPCPRCSSMDTKFCYYNNYNVNQPRHFCKSCQRYWTAGGTMRNVPVGAGRRKNKSPGSHSYRHISISQAPQAVQVDAPIGTRGAPNLKAAPVYDPVTHLQEKNAPNGTRNGFHSSEERKKDNCSSGSSVALSNTTAKGTGKCQKEQPVNSNLGGFPLPFPCFQWPYPWAIPALPGMLPPPGFAIPYYGPIDSWNISNAKLFPHQERAQCSGSESTTLGKHQREETEIPEQKKGCVLVPKTLRLNNPSEAAKSTIWVTLGIKKDTVNNSKGEAFNAFRSKGKDKIKVPETSAVLYANPAALSRSINFHENS